jgi:sortase (surface protein transpeptidase)
MYFAHNQSQMMKVVAAEMGETYAHVESVVDAEDSAELTAYSADLSIADYIMSTFSTTTPVCQTDYSEMAEVGDEEIASAVDEYISALPKSVKSGLSTVAKQMEKCERMIGRLYIPAVGMTPLALYAIGTKNDNTDYWKGQAITDREDSGTVVAIADALVIGDHAGQNFQVLENVKVGDYAYISYGSSVITLRCVNKTNDIYIGAHYNDFINSLSPFFGDMGGYVFMKTCNGLGDGRRVVVQWEVIDGDISSMYALADSYLHINTSVSCGN